MTARGKWPWTVWTRDGERCRHFRTFAGAEAYARRYVEAALRDTGGCLPAEIDRDRVPVAWVRADGLERIWTDMVADAAGLVA
jgi:hypothetical protein